MAGKDKRARGVEARRWGRWADLPGELLALIAERLSGRVDFQRFCATCRSWRSSASILPGRTLLVPPLIVSREDQTIQESFYTTEGFPCPAYKFDACVIHLVRQKKESTTTDGSSSNKSWLALAGKPHVPGTNQNRTMYVEFLSETALGHGREDIPKELDILDLSMSEVCKQYYFLAGSPVTWLRHFNAQTTIIQKIVFIFSRSVGEYAAVGLYGLDGRLAFLRSSGEGIWTPIDDYRTGYNDVIDYNGTFYAVHYTGKLLRIDLPFKVTEIASPVVRGKGGIQKCLIESAGDLLLVDKYLRYGNIRKIKVLTPKIWFKVYKLKKVEETNNFVEIRSLGDRMLFLTRLTRQYCNFSVSAQQLPGCKPNCIYLEENCENAYHLDGRFRWDLSTFRIGVFNLGDGTYERMEQWYDRCP